MHAGPPDVNYSEDLVERLGRLVSTVDDAGRTQLDRGKGLVHALTDQLAAGQTETLYGLQTAAKAVRDRSQDLMRLAEELPEAIGAQVQQLVDELTEAASAQITAALDTASTRLESVLENVHRDLSSQQEQYLNVLRESARATGSQLSTELEHAATTVVESAGRAKASQTAVRAAAVAVVEALESASASFTEDAEGVVQAISTVGDNFVERLFQVLDERDQREQVLDELLTKRVEQLTAHAERRLHALTAAVDDQLQRLEQRDLVERASTTAALTALVDRLLAEPRGRLRELRGNIRNQPAPAATSRQPLHAEPAYYEVYDELEPDQPPTPAPAKRSPAKKAPAKKAPVKRAPAKKSTTARKTATKNEDT